MRDQTWKLTLNVRTEGLPVPLHEKRKSRRTENVLRLGRERELKATLAVNSHRPSSATRPICSEKKDCSTIICRDINTASVAEICFI